jgi:trans-aconitate 2-methyltransferase
MPTWDSEQYLRFEAERTLPCRDLAGRVEIASASGIIDLGCGPGNSTRIAAQRWPDAQITGLDSSADMIAAARKAIPKNQWIVGDIRQWAGDNDTPFDLVFSNAAMQWVDDHAAALPSLMRQVSGGGALAFQMPGNFDAPAHVAMREIAASAAWRAAFSAGVREWHVHDLDFYYDVLAPHARRVDLWETEYIHVMSGPEVIVEWYKGTGLRPFLDALASDDQRRSFTAEYLEKIRAAYPSRKDGRTLFPFRRLFAVAYK